MHYDSCAWLQGLNNLAPSGPVNVCTTTHASALLALRDCMLEPEPFCSMFSPLKAPSGGAPVSADSSQSRCAEKPSPFGCTPARVRRHQAAERWPVPAVLLSSCTPVSHWLGNGTAYAPLIILCTLAHYAEATWMQALDQSHILEAALVCYKSRERARQTHRAPSSAH